MVGRGFLVIYLAFNSLFEMLVARMAEAKADLIDTFNSLFEMQYSNFPWITPDTELHFQFSI